MVSTEGDFQRIQERPVRPSMDPAVDYPQEEKHDIIHIKVTRLSNILDKVRFASNLPNSKSDHMVSVGTSTRDMIVSNPRRSIEEDNLLASNKIITDSIGQCIVKIRKADNINILAFKIAPSSFPNFFSK